MTDTNPRETERDTEKVSGLDLSAVLKWAKTNPWVLAVVASGSSLGGEQVSELIGQPIAAWQIMVGVGGFALLDIFTRMLKRLDKIEARLAEGTKVMERHDVALVELLAWREAAEKKKK